MGLIEEITKQADDKILTPVIVLREGSIEVNGFKNADEAFGFFHRQVRRYNFLGEFAYMAMSLKHNFKPSEAMVKYVMIFEDTIQFAGFKTFEECIHFLEQALVDLKDQDEEIEKMLHVQYPGVIG